MSDQIDCGLADLHVLSSESAVAFHAAPEGHAAGDDEEQRPRRLRSLSPTHRSWPVNFLQEHGRREVRQVLQRHDLHDRVPRLGQHVEREHVAGEKKVEQHVDEQQRADFQEPEADHADRGFEEEAEQERQDQRRDEGRTSRRRRPAGEVAAAEIEHERERPDRDAVVHELVSHALSSRKPIRSIGWTRYFLISPLRICSAMPPARPGMLENARLIIVSR